MRNPNGDVCVIPSTPPTMEERLKDGSVIPSTPPTMEEGLKDGSVIPSIPLAIEDPKYGSVIPSISPTMEDPEDGVIAKTAHLTIDDTNLIPKKNISFSILEKLNRGVIVEVRSLFEAIIAESAGAKAVSVTVDDRMSISRMAKPSLINEIKKQVRIPVMARVRVGHTSEAKLLETFNLVDFIDENELLNFADERYFINKRKFKVPFVCGCGDLSVAVKRMMEGAALIRIQGDIDNFHDVADVAVKVRAFMATVRSIRTMNDEAELFECAHQIGAPTDLIVKIKELPRFPVSVFASGEILTPADAALMMHLGCDGVFVRHTVFANHKPAELLRNMVKAVEHFDDLNALAHLMLR